MFSAAIDTILSIQFSQGFFDALLDATLKGTLVLAVAALILRSTKKFTASTRSFVWSGVLAAVLLLPALSMVLPSKSFHLIQDRAAKSPTLSSHSVSPAVNKAPGLDGNAVEVPKSVAPAMAVAVEQNSPPPMMSSLSSGVLMRVDVAAGEPLPFIPREQLSAVGSLGSSPRFTVPHWTVLVLLFWIGGVIVVLRHLTSGIFRAWLMTVSADQISDERLQKIVDQTSKDLGIRRPVRLMICEAAVVPMTWGVLNPVVLVPNEARRWSIDRWRVVLHHEFAHISRHDWMLQVVNRIVCAVYWFHPLVWMASRQQQIEREHACDDLVIKTGFRPSDYAGHLVEIARSCVHSGRQFSAALSMARPSDLEVRIVSILDKNRKRGSVTARLATWLVGGSAAAILVLSCWHVAVFADEEVKSVGTPPAIIAANDGGYEMPKPGWGWYVLGTEAHVVQDYDTAVYSFLSSAGYGFRPARSAYNAACAYAKLGQTDEAMAWLTKAVDLGYDEVNQIATDPDLGSIQKSQEFWDLMKHASKIDRDEVIRAKADRIPEGARSMEGVSDVDEWRNLADRYAPLTKEHSDNGTLLFHTGYAMIAAGQYEEARPLFERTMEMDHFADKSAYNVACCHARLGEADDAFEWLERAIALGHINWRAMQEDPDLENLRTDERFEMIIEEAREKEQADRSAGWAEEAAYEARLAIKEAGQALNDAMEEVEWATSEAHQAYAEAIAHTAKHREHVSSATFDRAFEYHNSGDYGKSSKLFQESYYADYSKANSAYNTACAYSRLGQMDKAYKWLMLAAEVGFTDVDHILQDDDLENLRADPGFVKVLREISMIGSGDSDGLYSTGHSSNDRNWFGN